MKIGEKDNDLIAELLDNFGSSSYEECANKIAKAIYNVYTSKTEQLFNNNKELMTYFKEKINEFKGNKEKKEEIKIIKRCQMILEIGEDLSTKEDIELEFDDIEFLDSKIWEFNDELTKKYPSLIYWLIKNQKSYLEIKNDKNIIEWYNKVKNNEKIEYIPIFILCLRLMSSFNCISFELININYKEYQKEKQIFITNEVIKNLNKRNKESLTNKWFNIVLKSVPSYIYDENYRFFYHYLNYLTDTKTNLEEFPIKIKDKMVNNFIKNVVNLVMDDKINDEIIKIYNSKEEKNEVLYLFNPAKMIYNKIINKKMKYYLIL
jgi:hypothetical protein